MVVLHLYIFLTFAYGFLHLSGLIHHPPSPCGPPIWFSAPLWTCVSSSSSSIFSVHLCPRNEKHFTPTIFYMNMILILRFETEILVTCISSFNFLFSFFYLIFSRDLLDIEYCDNAVALGKTQMQQVVGQNM